MKLALVLATATLSWGATVGNIRIDGLTHSSVRIIGDSSAVPNALRVEYATAPTSCNAGGNAPQQDGSGIYFQYAQPIDLAGLAPSTTYNACFEVSTDGGATWSAAVPISFTTSAAPNPDPALPIPPVTFNSTYPDTSSYNVVAAAADCSDLQTQINAASANLAAHGTVINVPIGPHCSGQYTFPMAADAQAITIAYDGTVTLAGHGFSNGQQVRLGTSGALPGTDVYPNGLNQSKTGAFQPGTIYYVRDVTSNTFKLAATNGGPALLPGYVNFTGDGATSSISITPDVGYLMNVQVTTNQPMQFTSAGSLPGGLSAGTTYYALSGCANANTICEFKVALSPGGSPVSISGAGSGIMTILTPGSGTQYLIAWPPSSNQIVIRSAASDAQLVAAGQRIGPAQQPNMATFARPATGVWNQDVMFTFGILAHSIRIGPGIEFTQTAAATGSNDPTPFAGWIRTNQDTGNVTLDRVYMHGLGAPNRVYQAIQTFDGVNMAMIGSYNSKWDFFHTQYTGLVPTRNSSLQLTLTAGSAHLASGNVCSATGTVTIQVASGLASGSGFVYFDSGCVLNVLAPTGMVLTCSAGGLTCTPSTTASPGFPVNSSGQSTVEKVATFTLAAGSIMSATAVDGYASMYDTEGCQCIIAGNGPGPWQFTNNWISGTGIPLHFDDSGGFYLSRHDATISQNTFDTPAYAMQGGPSSDGFRYGHRQPLEFKGMQRASIDGNIFQGHFEEDNPNAVAITITPRSGGQASDIDITNNTFVNTPAGVEIGGAIDASYYQASPSPSVPSQRFRYQNNLLYNVNGWTQIATPTVSSAGGWQFFGGYAINDVIVSHNTIFDPRGSSMEFWHQQQTPLEGAQITNNFIWPDSRMAFISENVTGCSGIGATGTTTLNCLFTKGIGTGSYIWGGNVAIPTWSNTQTASGATDPAAVSANFTGAGAFGAVVAGVDVPTRIAAVQWTNPAAGNFQLLATSPYHNAGSDGADVGINQAALQAAQGSGAAAPSGNPCDLNSDGTVNVLDVQAAVNMSLGITPCTANINGPDVCAVTTIQRVVNAALGGACVTGP